MYGPFIFLIAAIFAIGCFMYIIIMGPSPYHRDGCVGKAHRILKEVPIVLGGICCSLCFRCNQHKGRKACRGCCNNAMNERNWYMVGFYVLLVWPVEVLYLLFALPKLEASLASKALSWGLVCVSEYLYAKAIFSDPGKVTARNHIKEQQDYWEKRRQAPVKPGKGKSRAGVAKRGAGKSPADQGAAAAAARKWQFTVAEEYVLNRRYCVDGMLYALAGDGTSSEYSAAENDYCSAEGTLVGLGQGCTTCNMLRPARSKHCRMCNSCVRRFDHHCPWINNDVAEGTHRYFLGFLITHGISCTWACCDLFRYIKQFLISRSAWGWVLRLPGGKIYPIGLLDYVAIVINYCMLEGCLLFFAVCISLVLYGFWAYQMSFVTANLTMNDLNKIEDVSRFVSGLPSLDLVLREARRVQGRLDSIALRKPTALLKLEELPEDVLTDPAWADGSKKNKAYRKKVRKMLEYDLKGLYDRGRWENIKEVFFPYAILTPARVEAAEKAAPKFH